MKKIEKLKNLKENIINKKLNLKLNKNLLDFRKVKLN